MGFKWLDFKVTKRCNNKCTYCGVSHDPPSTPEILTIDEINGTLNDAIDIGFNHIAILGGEPSCRENIENVFSGVKAGQNVTVLVITNGLVFYEKMVRSAFESKAGVVKIVSSFDSFKEPNYKNQRPRDILSGIQKIKEIAEHYQARGLRREVEVHTVISRENFLDIDQTVDFFHNMDIDVSLALVCPSTFVKKKKVEKYNSFSFGELKAILSQLEALKSKGHLNFANTVLLEYLRRFPVGQVCLNSTCKAGKEHVIINFDGEVYPCITNSYLSDKSYGNIQKERFSEIYPRLHDFRCQRTIEPACWDHFLWNRLGSMMDGDS